ncbi:UNVERIFIED_CONTAM: hypothetical protein GTU68_042329 [Idotea baltica]|nr:hypothetical protein [Idotea baltica]
MVKELRDKTGAGMMDCKKALAESAGDVEAAVQALRKKGLKNVEKRSGRVAAEGTVLSYVHAGGRIGVLVEVNCETDFVARGDEFSELVKKIAMHIAWANPKYVAREVDVQDSASKKTIGSLINDASVSLGEKIAVRRFQRFEVGEGIEKEEVDYAAEVAAAAKVA